jgi:cholest-4-en-3-one 26-monooxygenase
MEDRIDLVDGEFWARNPHEELAWLRQHAPVWRDPRHGVWGVATYELVKQVSGQPQYFSSAGGIRPDQDPVPSMIDMDDPEHWKRRKLLNKGFTPKRVREQEAAIRRTVRLLLDAVAGREECDLVVDVAGWLPLIVIGDALGVEPPDREQLLTWSDDLLGMLGSNNADVLDRAMAAWTGYHEYASRVIAARKENPADDLVSLLVSAEVDGDRLEPEEIVQETLLVLIGGDETTRHVISGGGYQLLSKPERWRALTHDPSLLPGAIEEMLRWVSPVKNMARTATVEIELAGQLIPEGEKLLLLYPSANRDEKVFANPDEFDIRRSPNEHIAFGFGTHFCLGSTLARLELRVMFEELLARFPDMELVDQLEPPHRPTNFVSGYEALPVRLGRAARKP